MRALVVIPTYNEKANIRSLIAKILSLKISGLDILIIDDNSPDGTGQIADRLNKDSQRVKVIHRPGKLGLGTACIAGFKYALERNYDYVLEMDADFSHDPKYLPKFLDKAKEYDVVIGSRYIPGGKIIGWPPKRYFMSWTANFLTRWLLNLKPRDVTTGYKCYNRAYLGAVDWNKIVSVGYSFLVEAIYLATQKGFKIIEIPITFKDRTAGQSKISKKELLSSAKSVFRLAQLKIALGVALILAALIRFWGLGWRPLDGDEGAILLYASKGSLPDILARAVQDAHPPLLPIFVAPFIHLFHYWEFWGRVVPALSGIGLVWVSYAFARRFLGRWEAVLTGYLVAISGYLLFYSQEIRYYSLLAFLGLTSFYYFIRATRDKHWYYWVGYVIFTLAMLYTHHLGWFVLAGQGIYLLIIKNLRARTPSWLAALAAIFILYLPLLPTTIHQIIGRLGEQPSHFSLQDNFIGLLGAIYRFGSGRLILDLQPARIISLAVNSPLIFVGFIITLLLPLYLLYLGSRRIYKENKDFFTLGTTLFVVFGVLSLVTSSVGGGSTRYLVFLSPLYLTFIAAAIVKFWHKRTIQVFSVLFIMINFLSVGYHYYFQNRAPGAREIAAFINREMVESESVLMRGSFGGGEHLVFDYYSSKKVPVVDMFEDYRIGNLAQLRAVNPGQKVMEMLQSHQSVWFYDLTYSNEPIIGQDSEFKSEKFTLGQDKEQKDIVVWKFTR